jgi:putative ABC transport system permease protein
MTVALGIYSSSIARTFNQNFVDSLMYENGSEVVLREKWDFSSPDMAGMMPGMEDMGGDGENGSEEQEQKEIYEPPFYIHQQLPGVENAARVLKKSSRISLGSRSLGDGTLMGIDPVDFAQVTWFREDLTANHLHYYMNSLTSHRAAALVNREFYEENEFDPGDWITLRVGDKQVDFFIAGVIDLWPTIYPREFPLVVANLDYIQSQYIIEPYSVWLNLKEDANLQTIVDKLSEDGIYVVSIKDTQNEIIEGRREPQRMGLYGMLSIGFIVAVLITVLGFFLYNFLSLKKRMVQFGIMRSIGLSVTQLIAILSLEQLLSVGIAFGLGTVFGVITSRIFLPFLQISENIGGVVPDFRIIIQEGDIMKILIILGGTLVIGLIILGVILTKLKLHEAIQLGEDG